jgi:hypothetical protein
MACKEAVDSPITWIVHLLAPDAQRRRPSSAICLSLAYARPRRYAYRSGSLPFNPISGTRYKGINLILLMGRSWEDPRWMTYKQAQENLQTAEMYQDAAMDWGGWGVGRGRIGYGIGVGRVRYQRSRDAGAQGRFQKVVAWLTSYRTVGCHCHLSPVL